MLGNQAYDPIHWARAASMTTQEGRALKPAVELTAICKDYQIGEYFGGGIVKIASDFVRGRRAASQGRQMFRALDSISLTVEQGQIIGVIGPNGSGKSTLLKILAGITQPTDGQGVVRGRVAPLLEVGTGFNTELTGRENIFVNGMLLGMTTREIRRELPSIVEFSGISDHIETPIKRYSSGMKVRLGFSIAAHLRPDILLADEILAVGDAEFQRKCMGKMQQINEGGRTIFFVSHQMELIRKICTRVVRLDRGRLVDDGPAESVIQRYYEAIFGTGVSKDLLVGSERRKGNGVFRIARATVRQPGAEADNMVECGAPFDIIVEWKGFEPEKMRKMQIECLIRNASGEIVTTLSTRAKDQPFVDPPADGRTVCHVPRLGLQPGRYVLGVVGRLWESVGADSVNEAAIFDVIPGDYYGTGRPIDDRATVLADHEWRPAESIEGLEAPVSAVDERAPVGPAAAGR